MKTSKALIIGLCLMLANPSNGQQKNDATLDLLKENIIQILNKKEKSGKKTYHRIISFWFMEEVNFEYVHILDHPREVDSIYFKGETIFFHSPEFTVEFDNEGKKTKRFFEEKTLKFSFLDENIRVRNDLYHLQLGKYITLKIPISFSGFFGDLSNFMINYQNKIKQKHYFEEIEKFKINVENYKKQNLNTTISEEQRKFIVQANVTNEKKNYETALELYEKAMEVNEFSYPQAYYNMSLIAAESKNYHYAIFNMKKYLILVPDASDARNAQDKIYEWEYEITK